MLVQQCGQARVARFQSHSWASIRSACSATSSTAGRLAGSVSRHRMTSCLHRRAGGWSHRLSRALQLHSAQGRPQASTMFDSRAFTAAPRLQQACARPHVTTQQTKAHLRASGQPGATSSGQLRRPLRQGAWDRRVATAAGGVVCRTGLRPTANAAQTHACSSQDPRAFSLDHSQHEAAARLARRALKGALTAEQEVEQAPQAPHVHPLVCSGSRGGGGRGHVGNHWSSSLQVNAAEVEGARWNPLAAVGTHWQLFASMRPSWKHR